MKKSSADGQVQIDGKWAVQVGGKAEARVLYIILRNKNDRWSVVSVKSASK